jgi:hypothetical protein
MQPGLALPLPHALDPFQLNAEVRKDGREQLVAGERVFVELAVADDVSQGAPAGGGLWRSGRRGRLNGVFQASPVLLTQVLPRLGYFLVTASKVS